MRMLGTRDAIKVTKEKGHCFLGVHEVNDLLVLSALTHVSFMNLFIVNGTFLLFHIIVLNDILSTYCAEGATTLMQDQRHSLL
jgi:hypothetical protein